jgi:hypothetical protein
MREHCPAAADDEAEGGFDPTPERISSIPERRQPLVVDVD